MRSLIIFELIAFGVLLVALWRHNKGSRVKAIIGLIMIVVGVIATKSWIVIPPATVAAIYDPLRGGILPYDMGEGWKLVPPWVTVRLFSVRTQNYTMGSMTQETGEKAEDAIQSQTSEGLSLNVDCSILYRIAPGDANRVWRAVGPNYLQVVLRPNAREATRVIIAEYPIMSVYSNAPPHTNGVAGVDFYPGKRQEVATRISERLAAAFQEKGITLDRFLLRNVDYMQPTFEKSIVDKQVAQQRVVTQQYEAEIQQIRAKANIVRAEGDAEAIRLKAAALQVQPKVVEWEMVEKLPDDLEVIIVPGRSMPIISMPEGGTKPFTPPSAPPQPSTPPDMRQMQQQMQQQQGR